MWIGAQAGDKKVTLDRFIGHIHRAPETGPTERKVCTSVLRPGAQQPWPPPCGTNAAAVASALVSQPVSWSDTLEGAHTRGQGTSHPGDLGRRRAAPPREDTTAGGLVWLAGHESHTLPLLSGPPALPREEVRLPAPEPHS